MSDVEPDNDASRLYAPCSEFGEDDLVVSCNEACDGRIYARCCVHKRKICHHARVVYTDRACTNNGRFGAAAGIGIAFGTRQDDTKDGGTHQFSIPVDDILDPGGKRTNQRAELLAALEGLKKICDHDDEWLMDLCERQDRGKSLPAIVITTDSEYVVKGVTEWLPKWKRNGLRNPSAKQPTNLDLFCKLDSEVKERERRHDCQVYFWHIYRTYNSIADQLAKSGAHAALLV